MSLGYAVKAASADVATDGHYFPATNVLTLCLVDSDGATAPIPPVGTEIALGYCNPWGAISSDTLTVVSTAVMPFHLTITFTIEGGQPAISSGDVTLVYFVTTPEIDTVYTYWARRNDFAAGDFVSSGNAGLVTVADSRYVIRRDPYWVEGDRRNRIHPDSARGVGVRRNSDHLERLSRRIGPSAVSALRWCSVRGDDELKCSLCGRGADPAN